jgi:hypothetical protein
MSFIKELKNKAGKYFLGRKKNRDRSVSTQNFEISRSIALLFTAKSESDFILVKQYRKHLQAEYGIKKVEALGWVDEKELPDYTVTQRGFIFLNPLKTNWFLQPEDEEYTAFIDYPFDILIDLSFEENVSLRFALKQSKDKMKVGRFSEEDYKLYDMTLNLPANALLDEYLRQTDKYLNLIQP